MDKQSISVKAENLRRSDVAWHRDAERFAVVSRVSLHPEPDKVVVDFLVGGERDVPQVFSVGEQVKLKARGLNAQRVIDRLCVPEGETASAWRSERRADHTFHAGWIMNDGPEFVAALGAWENGGHIRLLTHGGEFPYSFSLADDVGLAMIDYCEGDIGVRVFDEVEGYVRALDLYLRGPLECDERRAEHKRNVARALQTKTFPGSPEFE